MKELTLSNGGLAIIDDDDFDRLSAHKWYRNNRGYIVRSKYHQGKQIAILIHREITKAPKGKSATLFTI